MVALLWFVFAILASPLKSRSRLEAENAALRHQLIILCRQRHIRVRLTNNDRWFFIQMYRWFPSVLKVLTVVRPETLVRWHRKGFRLFWKWKSRSSGRPKVPTDVRRLIAEMATNNPTWGEERIANELLLKIGIQISPRTVRRYLPKEPKRPTVPSQRWMTFVRNHAKAIIAADFFIVVTSTFRLAYVLSSWRSARAGLFTRK